MRNRVTPEIGRRHRDVLSFEKFVLQSIVLELLELLEGLQRSGTHVTRISPNCLSRALVLKLLLDMTCGTPNAPQP
jgi:hypothetical protein